MLFLWRQLHLFSFLAGQPLSSDTIAWAQKLSVSLLAAGTNAVMFLLLWKLSKAPRLSLIATAGFALGTSQLLIASDAIWQHGPANFLVVASLYFLLIGERINSSKMFLRAAVPLSLLPFIRPPLGILWVAVLVYVLVKKRPLLWSFAVLSSLGLLLALVSNWVIYEHPLGGYGLHSKRVDFSKASIEGFVGMFFSPNRGMFIFSPFLALGVFGALRYFRALRPCRDAPCSSSSLSACSHTKRGMACRMVLWTSIYR